MITNAEVQTAVRDVVREIIREEVRKVMADSRMTQQLKEKTHKLVEQCLGEVKVTVRE